MSAPRVTPQEIVEMHRLYAQLGTYAAVGRKLGRSGSTVAKYIQMKGVATPISSTKFNAKTGVLKNGRPKERKSPKRKKSECGSFIKAGLPLLKLPKDCIEIQIPFQVMCMNMELLLEQQVL